MSSIGEGLDYIIKQNDVLIAQGNLLEAQSDKIVVMLEYITKLVETK